MKLKLTKELEAILKNRGGEEYVIDIIMYYLGNVEMISLYEYNNIAKMKVNIYDLGALWKDGYSPIERLFNKTYKSPKKRRNKNDQKNK